MYALSLPLLKLMFLVTLPSQELAVPLRDYVNNFPRKHYLHPYERALVELTIGDGNYEEVTHFEPPQWFLDMRLY